MPILIEHANRSPRIARTAYVAPNAVLSGEVIVGDDARVLFGAVLTAEGGPVEVGKRSIIMEQAVLRGSLRHPVRVGVNVLVGPHAHLTGCTVEDDCFLATGCAVFNGARIGRGSEVRIHGVVHLRSVLAPGSLVPIGWVAVGDPAQIFPPDEHDRIWAIQQPLDFPRTVFGLDREPERDLMPEIATRYGAALAKHLRDREVE